MLYLFIFAWYNNYKFWLKLSFSRILHLNEKRI